jgi:serine beta-lactamase-like protein LACTB, mitochondrial
MRHYFILVVFIIPSFGFAQKSDNAYSTAIKQSRDSIEKLMKQRLIPGLAITVSVDGKVVWSQGFGFADLEQKVVVDPSKTKFRIGSISKALTASGLAKLYEGNKIILDSSIYYYLPNYPKHKYRPTVCQVAGHIAGVRHYKGNEWYSAQNYSSVTEGISMFKNDSLQFRPGAKYQYTSHGFNLLSAVIEKASNENFLSFMQNEVLIPLNLNNTVPDLNDSIISYRSRFYDLKKNRLENSPYVNNSYKWAGGGFISTSEDIATFANILLTTKFLKSETITIFTTPQQLNDGKFTSYGMGFASGTDSGNVKWFGHSGGSVGGTSDMVIYPVKKITVVILTNLSNAKLNGIARRIAKLYMKSDTSK